MPFIYCITNTINNKKYIGQTVTSLSERYAKHKYDAFSHQSTYAIHTAMRKYGFDAFKINQIEECSLSELDEREQYWIQYYDTYNKGYNETRGGEGNQRYNYYQIYNLFNQGLNQTEIADLVGCDRHTVKRVLNAFDINDDVTKSHKYGNAKKQVLCIEKQTLQILNVFSSLTEAARYEGISIAYMSLICNNKRKLNKNYTYMKTKGEYNVTD